MVYIVFARISPKPFSMGLIVLAIISPNLFSMGLIVLARISPNLFSMGLIVLTIISPSLFFMFLCHYVPRLYGLDSIGDDKPESLLYGLDATYDNKPEPLFYGLDSIGDDKPEPLSCGLDTTYDSYFISYTTNLKRSDWEKNQTVKLALSMGVICPKPDFTQGAQELSPQRFPPALTGPSQTLIARYARYAEISPHLPAPAETSVPRNIREPARLY